MPKVCDSFGRPYGIPPPQDYPMADDSIEREVRLFVTPAPDYRLNVWQIKWCLGYPSGDRKNLIIRSVGPTQEPNIPQLTNWGTTTRLVPVAEFKEQEKTSFYLGKLTAAQRGHLEFLCNRLDTQGCKNSEAWWTPITTELLGYKLIDSDHWTYALSKAWAVRMPR